MVENIENLFKTQPNTKNTAEIVSILLDEQPIREALLSIFFSATYGTREVVVEKPDPMDPEKSIKVHEKKKDILRLPNDKRICPVCKKIVNDPDWAVCSGDNNSHKAVATQWYQWKPFLTQQGFSEISQYILTHTAPLFSTTRISNKGARIQDDAVTLAQKVAELIFINKDAWCTVEYIPEQKYTLIETTVYRLVESTASRSLDGATLDKILAQWNVREDISPIPLPQPQHRNKGGIVDTINSIFSV